MEKMLVPPEMFSEQLILPNASLHVEIEPSTEIQPNGKHSLQNPTATLMEMVFLVLCCQLPAYDL